MFEAIGQLLAGFLTGRNPPRQPSVANAYAAAYERATSGEGFVDAVLRDELQIHAVPGSHTEERDGKRIGVAFAAWDRRIEPAAFYNFFLRFNG